MSDKKKKKKLKTILACEVCSNRNYSTETSPAAKSQRFEIKKFCPHCNTHTLHKETR